MKRQYQVIEDSGGGLALVVFNTKGNVEYMHTGYEFVHGQLQDDISILDRGGSPKNWDGNEVNPQRLYEKITAERCGWNIIMDQNFLYPERMGASGHRELGV